MLLFHSIEHNVTIIIILLIIVAMIIIIIIYVTMSIFIFMCMQVPSNTLAEDTVYFHWARQVLFGGLLVPLGSDS